MGCVGLKFGSGNRRADDSRPYEMGGIFPAFRRGRRPRRPAGGPGGRPYGNPPALRAAPFQKGAGRGMALPYGPNGTTLEIETVPLIRLAFGQPPYPFWPSAISLSPLSRYARHLPLIRGVGPLTGGIGLPPGEGRATTTQAARIGNPGAEIGPHQPQFLQTQGPVARREFRPVTQILRAGNIASSSSSAFPVTGSGVSEYERGALILSEPRRFFGSFLIDEKGTRRPGPGPLEKKPIFGGEIGNTPGRRAGSSRPTKEAAK